ncbi:MAG: hypothetical protein NC432_12180 [Roseburia sp.]|nr:hypothetical protein [Roseburia sp.]MCM1097250.1 hypothetical protein [Ruminococcus flavefaciens]
MTLEQLLPEKSGKPRYKKIIQKCRNLNPDERYQAVRQVRQAFQRAGRIVPGSLAAALLLGFIACFLGGAFALRDNGQAEGGEESSDLIVLPAPGNPHWDGETGITVWDNVLESGNGDEVQFSFRLYRRDADNPPSPEDDDWYFEDVIRLGGSFRNREIVAYNSVTDWRGNGYYYFTVVAVGDGVRYTDSPYVVSDVFEYTGESAPYLPSPTGLAWRMYEKDNTRLYCATWSNLDDYGDKDIFNVTFYDEAGEYVMNNTWTMDWVREFGYGGITIPAEFLKNEPGSAYRFTVQVYSSRPNEYQASFLPEPVTEEYYSPWLYYGAKE